MKDPALLYNEDFVLWTEQQAAVLRAAASGGINQALDSENLAEEIESLGRSDKREVRSQIYRIIRHLAKLQFSPAPDPWCGWRESIRDGRQQTQIMLGDSPSLKSQLDEFASEESADAIERAIADLAEYGEIAPETDQALRAAQYSVDQVLGSWFPPEPTRLTDPTLARAGTPGTEPG